MKRQFGRAAASYDEVAVLAREVVARMAERLDYIKLAPQRMADIGCATGDGIRELQARYPQAQAIAIDYVLPMVHQVRMHTPRLMRLTRRGPQLVNADARALPLAGSTLDLIWSSLMLQWLDDPLSALREWHRSLRSGGLLMFATLGPDTVKELRHAAGKIGVGDTVRKFPDMHDLGDMLLAAGFADPVMDMEMISFSYSGPRQFLADQRCLGVRDPLLGQQTFRDWRRLFAACERDADGRLPLRFEIVYGHAWKSESKHSADGRTVIKFHPR
ncbi:MAG: methyltransferase domain-containing protein [Rugosibacter sp.]|nr:methyltransferase domain-containing protein [Rugosibacter sp.]